MRLLLVQAVDMGTCDSVASMSMLAWLERQRRQQVGA
jgi:hypothetical protein